MDIEILKVNNKEMALIANKFLTKLIHDEKKYDNNINEKYIVNSMYDISFDNDNLCILLAKYKNKYVGYLFGYLMNIGDAYIEKQSKLDAMFVDDEYRENRIGSLLIDEFKKWSLRKGAKYVELTVCKDNVAAKNLYKNNGFRQTKMIMQCKIK